MFDRLGKASLLVVLLAIAVTAKPRKLTIVALGDSTTAGTPFFQSPLETPPTGSGDPEGQYTYWLTRNHPTWDAVNCGIAGQRSDEIRARFDDIYKYHPQYVVILAGVNDIYQNEPIEQVQDNLAWMYKQAMRHQITPIAATVLPFDKATPNQAAAIRQLNAWIIRKAQDVPIPIVNLNAVVADPSDRNRLNGSPDGLHPDMGGYRLIGVTIARLIESLEGVRPDR